MDQNIEPRDETVDIEAVMAAVTRRGGYAFVPREGKEGVYVLSIAEYHRLNPPPEWMQAMWDHAKARGLDKMTMEEIDAEIAEARREMAEKASVPR